MDPCADEVSPTIATAPSSPSAIADPMSTGVARPGRARAEATARTRPVRVTTSGGTRAVVSGRASRHIARSHHKRTPRLTSYPGCRAAHRARRSSSANRADGLRTTSRAYPQDVADSASGRSRSGCADSISDRGGSASAEDRVLVSTRVVSAAIVPFLLLAFAVLVPWPSDTKRLFAWAISRRCWR